MAKCVQLRNWVALLFAQTLEKGQSAAIPTLADALKIIGVWPNCGQLTNWQTLLLSQKMAYGQSAAYSDKLVWLSRQVSGPKDPSEPRIGTPRAVWEFPLSLT